MLQILEIGITRTKDKQRLAETCENGTRAAGSGMILISELRKRVYSK